MKVSIIVPVYNMEKRLKRCLDSIVGQTYSNIEIILINDGSKDNSLKILKSYEKKDNRIKLIDQPNQGISVSRNNGLKISSGDYICFADSDDYIEKNMIEKLVECIEEEKADIAVCNYYIFDDSGKKVKKDIGADNLFGSTLNNNPQLITDIDYAPWNKIYKKELFDNIYFPPNTKYEDFETILKVFSKAKKIVKLDEYLYDYYVNMSGETRTDSPKNKDMLKIISNLNEFFDFSNKNIELKDCFFETASEKLLHSASSIFKVCSTKDCLNYINSVYSFLNDNCKNWKKLYKTNKFDSNFIKFIRGNKMFLKSYAFLRTSIYKIFLK